mmetsp:Transcript_43098/g.89731  ORF Transcript_43098/g.89731 Transcript_43098/m.89731 type:complete len:273 (-) Transcript_43098:24-842(-)
MMFHSSTRSPLLRLAALSVLVCLGQAFVVPSSTHQRHNGQLTTSAYDSSPIEECSVSLSAKKRRRRRKDGANSSPPSAEQSAESIASESSEPALAPGELPDFDLDGDEATEKPRPKINPNEITENMMGSGNMSSRSLDELISNRALENKLEFDEKGDPSIPDFVDLARASSTTPTYDAESSLSTAGVGKKKQRQAERIAKAIAAKEAEAPVESFLSNVPQFLNEKGEVSAIKILEQGAWVGIFILVGWEVYINSPLFDRAAPLAPLVYEILM